MIEVYANPAQLKWIGQALTDLEAQRFIKTGLPTHAMEVLDAMRVYPAEGIVLKSSQRVRAERARARSIGNIFGLGKFAASLVSTRDTGHGPSNYKRTQNYKNSWGYTLEQLNEHITNYAEYAGYVGGLDASPGGRSRSKGNQPYTWRYGWPRLKKMAEDVMDRWIPMMEDKAYYLWER